MKLPSLVGLVFVVVFLVFGLHKATMAARRLLSPPSILSGAGEIGRSLDGIAVRSVESERVIELGAVRHALLLVFDPDCGPCNANMANWIDLLAATRQTGVGVVALRLNRTSDNSDRPYWSAFEGRVPVFLSDSTSMVAAGLRATPTTILIRHGRVAAEFVGILNRREMQQLTEEVQRTDRGATGVAIVDIGYQG